MSRKSIEFERFDKTMDVLLKATHGDLKAALDAEKVEKAKKKAQKQGRKK